MVALNPFAPIPVIERVIERVIPRKMTREEYSALLDEAVKMAEELLKKVDDMGEWLEQNAKPVLKCSNDDNDPIL